MAKQLKNWDRKNRSLKFYTYPSCTSCRKAKAWLTSQGIPYEEHHLFKSPPTTDELKELIKLTQNGLDDILATRSQKFKSLDIDYHDLKVSQLLEMIAEDPRLLRRPLITDGEQLIVGYNKEALEQLLA